MVKYYGRARQRVGSVNTNQIGLKMSGCPSKVGRKGVIDRYISRRSQCNQTYCGPVFYHGVIWSWNNTRCVAKAPRGQSFNAGVGHKANPRFACGDTCVAGWDPNRAFQILQEFFNTSTQSVILIGKTETLLADLPADVVAQLQALGTWPITHYYPGQPEYAALPPYIKQAVDTINNLGILGQIGSGPPAPHVVGVATYTDQTLLREAGFGMGLVFAPENTVMMYSLAPKTQNKVPSTFWCPRGWSWLPWCSVEGPGGVEVTESVVGGVIVPPIIPVI